MLVTLDFAENYKYVAQDASQAFHFNNDQCTVFTVVYYFLEDSEVRHRSFVFLSDSTSHDTAAVFTIQKLLLPEIKKHVNVDKIIYFSDGAKQHFKNRYQGVNLKNHKRDFGVTAEWHCHATAHGKNACDGVGAVFKREAARASLLAKPSEAILNATALYNWGKQKFSNISVLFYSKVAHEKSKRFLKCRFQTAPSIPNIQKSHSFVVLENDKLLIKRYSYALNGIIFPE